MKFSDYRRLGKISIKSRKKSTRNTVRGISFGLIILIPIVFFSLAFYLDLTKKINNFQTISSFTVETKHYNDLTPTIEQDTENYYGLLAYENLETMINIVGVSNAIVGEYYTLDLYNTSYEDGKEISSIMVIDGTKELEYKYAYSHLATNDKRHLNNLLKVCHPEMSNNRYFTDSELNDLKLMGYDSPYLAGDGFTGSGQGQIILSELFLNEFFIVPDAIIGKPITIKMLINSYSRIDNNTNPFDDFAIESSQSFNGYYEIIKDFTVVGILREAVYNLKSRNSEADYWITTSSLYDENNNSYLPISTMHIDERDGYQNKYLVYTYQSINIEDLVKEANDAQLAFLPIGFGASYIQGENYHKPILRTILQSENYQSAYKNEKIIKAIYSTAYPTYLPQITNSTYGVFSSIYITGIYIIIILLSFGGIIFFATLLNLYNSINYSVQSRTNYIGLMRANGAKNRMIPRLYFFEIMLIFLRSSLWIIIFSGGISYLMKNMVDQGFKRISDFLPFTISLNILYYPLALIITVIFEYFIAFIYSQIACHHVARKPILYILKDER